MTQKRGRAKEKGRRSDVGRKSECDYCGAREPDVERPRCFSERTEKVISIGASHGGARGKRHRRKKRGRKREDAERMREGQRKDSIGEGRRQPGRRMPLLPVVLGPARFSRVRSVLGEATFFSATCTFRVFSIRGPTSRPLRARTPLLLFPLISTYLSCAKRFLSNVSRARDLSSSPPITPTPKGMRARARTRCVAADREIATPSVNSNERCRIAIASTS